jgi:hypothetical protein
MPIVPTLGMHPGVAVVFGSEGDDGMRVTVRFLAPGATIGIGMLQVAVQPLDPARTA